MTGTAAPRSSRDPRSSGTQWLGAYIFTRTFAPDLLDDVVVDVIAPILDDAFVQRSAVRSFFVRFTTYGPHVRLRIKAPAETLNDIRARVEAGVARDLSVAHRGIPTGPLPDAAMPTSDPSLIFQPYEPETERYGGPWGLAAAESFFDATSRLSIGLLAAVREQRLDRAGIGLGVMIAILHGLARGARQTASLAKGYADSFGRGWVERWYGSDEAEIRVDRPVRELEGALAPQLDAFRRAARADALPDAIGAYGAAAAQYRRRLARLVAARRFFGTGNVPLRTIQGALDYVAPSLVHMTTNRLGIDNPLEVCLTETLARSYQRDP